MSDTKRFEMYLGCNGQKTFLAKLGLLVPPELFTRSVQAERERLEKWVRDLMERREYATCWYSDDDGDCGNWPTCNPHCTLREMMDAVGFKPQVDGGIDKQDPHPPHAEAQGDGERRAT